MCGDHTEGPRIIVDVSIEGRLVEPRKLEEVDMSRSHAMLRELYRLGAVVLADGQGA